VVLVIAFPILVTGLLDAPSTVDPNKVKIDIQAPDQSDEEAPPVFVPRPRAN
jgi:hypothetical protein